MADARRLVGALIAIMLVAVAPPALGRETNAYAFSFTSIDGEAMPLEAYRGHPILLVNTASYCGYTHQYAGLQTLWERYRARGLVVIGVPSNQFGAQEPGSEAEIKRFCALNYDIEFPMTQKALVRGEDAHPLYRWLRSLNAETEPRWNFHKILIAPDGSLAGIWPTQVAPLDADLIDAVEALVTQ